MISIVKKRVNCKDNQSTLLLNFQDTTVTELAQDLAKKLGLKGRKAYVSPQTESTGTDGESLGENSSPTGDVSDACKLLRSYLVLPLFRTSSDVLQRAGISWRHWTRYD